MGPSLRCARPACRPHPTDSSPRGRTGSSGVAPAKRSLQRIRSTQTRVSSRGGLPQSATHAIFRCCVPVCCAASALIAFAARAQARLRCACVGGRGNRCQSPADRQTSAFCPLLSLSLSSGEIWPTSGQTWPTSMKVGHTHDRNRRDLLGFRSMSTNFVWACTEA